MVVSLIRVSAVISIHALREESDRIVADPESKQTKFQSTLSVRRATPADHRALRPRIPFQSTLSVRRATDRLV